MNGAGSFRRYVTGNPVRPGELAKEPLQSVPVALNRRIVLRVRPFQIALRHQAWATVTGTNDVHHVYIALLNRLIKENDVNTLLNAEKNSVHGPMHQGQGFAAVKVLDKKITPEAEFQKTFKDKYIQEINDIRKNVRHGDRIEKFE